MIRIGLRESLEQLRDSKWLQDAACQDVDDASIFFSHNGHTEGLQDVYEAKLYCAECPVREECLDHAMTNNERYGIWGGLDEKERRRLKRDQRLRRKLREEAAKRVEEERRNGVVIRTRTRVVMRRTVEW